MADPLPPRPVVGRPRTTLQAAQVSQAAGPAAGTRAGRTRPLGALALLGAATLLVGCAAGAQPSASAGSRPPAHRDLAVPPAPLTGRAAGPPPAGVPAQPAPVRALAIAYPAPPTPPVPPDRAVSRLRAGMSGRRPHPVPGRPAAPVPQQRQARTAAPRGLPQVNVCELGRHYGGWPAGSPQEAACLAVYG